MIDNLSEYSSFRLRPHNTIYHAMKPNDIEPEDPLR